MSEERAVLIGVCRPVPNVLSFVTPIFRDKAGASVAQMVKDGRIVGFQEVDLGQEFVSLRSRATAGVGDPALYAMEFEDCISVGSVISEVASGSRDVVGGADANAIKAAFGRSRNMRSSGFLTFRRRTEQRGQFESDSEEEVFPNRRRGDRFERIIERKWRDDRSPGPRMVRRWKRIASSDGLAQLEVSSDVGGVLILPQSEVQDDRLIEWFGKWRKPIRSWLRDRASVAPADIDDVAQEVFLRLLRYSDDIEADNPQAYLFRVAANVANEWRERSRARKPDDDSWLEELQKESVEEPENAFARTQANAYVQAAVERLPKQQREIFLMHVNEGLTYKQIAQQRGVAYRVVLRELTRAYAALRQQLRLEDL